jgi:26S proteasome regulatory subunit N11
MLFQASVEAIDETFQVEMLDMLKQTDRSQSVVGWYHSHPGFGCWLSSVDINTQTSFEGLNPRCVAVVIDPVQSVKGKVAIDAFRLFPQEMMMAMMMGGMGGGNEPRQTTSNVGFLKKPTIQARIHGLDRMYYSLVVDWRKNDVEEQMLMNLHKKNWSTGLVLPKIEDHQASTLSLLDKMTKLSKDYAERVKEEDGKSKEEIYLLNVGKVDPKKHLENTVYDLVSLNILQCLGTMVNTVVF